MFSVQSVRQFFALQSYCTSLHLPWLGWLITLTESKGWRHSPTVLVLLSPKTRRPGWNLCRSSAWPMATASQAGKRGGGGEGMGERNGRMRFALLWQCRRGRHRMKCSGNSKSLHMLALWSMGRWGGKSIPNGIWKSNLTNLEMWLCNFYYTFNEVHLSGLSTLLEGFFCCCRHWPKKILDT